MHTTLNQWLNELEVETEIVQSTDINEEANSNLVTFGINESLLKEWGRGSLEDFIGKCAELFNSKNTKKTMIFYSWFDDMAGQIRISAVSESHGKLPFGCIIHDVKLNELIKNINFETSDVAEPYTLKVWQKGI
ncbi:hypothetical protein E2K93_17135 [Thalassotalea sp. HSM 43]|uniref:hypothetical protein n=1 Tax=Thalassotalea sp. HSM 43 TaxID=2552945 RepID=UPI00107FD76D|nr:hypothetical protein [Thalassotalea sp. HSM 43]QBY05039.1 hypothetical protein E2K93_11870 [Thalassotalea sp. HSM 43]QBY05982.1 hypothetical protein E2K93_17135 [Thalassotalea sp. HSM 43]